MAYLERQTPLPDFSTDAVHSDEVPAQENVVSTGTLPDVERVHALIETAHERYRGLDDGKVADYIPSLGEADPALFGISVCGVGGQTTSVGDSSHPFSIQSISKVFVFALVCHELGHSEVSRRVGVNNTGLPFNSVMALELSEGDPRNPLVNAGAITTTSLAPGSTAAEKWDFVQRGLSRFAGRRLEIDDEVYASESATNQRNMAIARLLQSYGRMEFDPIQATDVYTRQCSLLVTAEDLAVMAATLANGGVNPITREKVIDASVCRDTLAVMATSGLYEFSGDWLFEVGIPAKSGVSGGIVTVAPGKGGLGTFSPRLDPAGNSVRGQRAARFLSHSLGLDIFASAPGGA
ncbi:glutaminase A [Leifsonia shinshuensis]|uniref:glutaminase A n=1 Tax=Leifsonia shinshuensis TaxID=150026 RepID=UPI002859C969|nr:glutaminase A [Leifsonia shinshuensis]MDR6970568.1 glutaminase [Leifsonia shinshuensis]